MLFASGSGLDPHITPEAAMLQVDRIARVRHFSESQKDSLKNIIERLTEPPQFLCLGQKRINVLLLNLETDKIK
jgi:K+-transporting ATPase ATPase C chain